ncbi:MAG: hypothetical protein ACK54K_17690, partial [Gemmatimonadaceae bacterium]
TVGGAAGDDAPRAVAGRTRQRVHLNDLREERRRRAVAHRRVGAVGASSGAGSIAGGPSATTGVAWSRRPRGRLAYQP